MYIQTEQETRDKNRLIINWRRCEKRHRDSDVEQLIRKDKMCDCVVFCRFASHSIIMNAILFSRPNKPFRSMFNHAIDIFSFTMVFYYINTRYTYTAHMKQSK